MHYLLTPCRLGVKRVVLQFLGLTECQPSDYFVNFLAALDRQAEVSITKPLPPALTFRAQLAISLIQFHKVGHSKDVLISAAAEVDDNDFIRLHKRSALHDLGDGMRRLQSGDDAFNGR